MSLLCAKSALAIAFVQVNAFVPSNPQSTVTVAYNSAQTAGNLNVVAIGWGDTTATITSVTDTKGNAYQLAVGPTLYSGVGTASVYYAVNIVGASAGANTVTVKFNTAAVYPDVRILEYSGIVTSSPIDVTAAAIGSGTLASSGLGTTTGANDLLFGSDLAGTLSTGGGPGFNLRVNTAAGNVAEDATVTPGAYDTSATISPTGGWIMQLVAFKGTVTSGTQPTAPTNLAGSASGGQINLSWTASTDTGSTIASYQIMRCQSVGCVNFTTDGSITGSTVTYTDTGIADSSSYTYRVRATDALGYTSGYSNAVTVTTSSNCCDSTPPSTPTGLTATAASSSEINLMWTASTDNVGVASYQIHRCQGSGCNSYVTVGTVPPQTSFSDTGLSAATSYTYYLVAADAAGNQSANSATATATTLTSSGGGGDTTPPTAPTGLGATVVSSTQINLAWTASTDNVGVTGYLVERCSGTGCTNFVQIASPTTTSYSDSTLSASTPYSYRVRATDAAHNLSAYSSIVSETTSAGSGGSGICD
jgi:fibronectin type 3 domain-containing protein